MDKKHLAENEISLTGDHYQDVDKGRRAITIAGVAGTLAAVTYPYLPGFMRKALANSPTNEKAPAKAETEQRELNVLVLGDSNSQTNLEGVPLDEQPAFIQERGNLNWIDISNSWLTQSSTNFVNFFNLAEGGKSLTAIEYGSDNLQYFTDSRKQSILEITAGAAIDHVVLALGTVDMLFNQGLHPMIDGWHKAIGEIIESTHCSEITLVVPPILVQERIIDQVRQGKINIEFPNINALTAISLAVDAQFKNGAFINKLQIKHPNIIIRIADIPNDPNLLGQDGIHLNLDGQSAVATAILQALAPSINKVREERTRRFGRRSLFTRYFEA